MKIILAVTGASGSLYALEFLKIMQDLEVELHGIISRAGRVVMKHELGVIPDDLNGYVERWYPIDDFTAPMSSGSSGFDAMVILPCTMGSLGAIANGLSENLIHRAADVMLKEQRPLLMAVRETPFSRIHLQNMLKVQEAGAVICPPMPSFYHHPEDLAEMARFFASRVGDLLGLPVPNRKRWQGIT